MVSWTSLIINLVVVASSIFILPYILNEPTNKVMVDNLPMELQKWHASGTYTKVYDQTIFYKYIPAHSEDKITYVLIHGFPTSSFDYHHVIEQLIASGDGVLVHDHPGFGFSSKPRENFTYSMSELAEHTLELWRIVGLQGKVRAVAHDMGDTILCEILARRKRNQLPQLKFQIASATFTNGGMNYARINLRISQILLSARGLGAWFSALSVRSGLNDLIAPRQLASIYSRSADQSSMWKDINEIILMNKINNGHQLFHKTIYYLNDRINFEFCYYPALIKSDLPIKLIWGDSDAVAPMRIAEYIHSLNPEGIDLRILPNVGHFSMLEAPDAWLYHVIN